MSLYFFDDVFLLYFALEATQGVFQRLAFLEPDFRQKQHPLTILNFVVAYSYNKYLLGKVKLDFRAWLAFVGTETNAARREPADLAPHPPEGPSGDGTRGLRIP